MSEERLQMAVTRLLDSTGLRWCHVPNGGQRNAIVAAKLKAQGVKPGVPDLLVFEPMLVKVDVPLMKSRGFSLQDLMDGKDTVQETKVQCGLAIELKNGKAGRVSPSQQEWMDALRERGWRVEVCRSLDEVLEVLRECYPHKFKKVA